MILELTSLASAALMPCTPVEGVDALWPPSIRWVIVGEIHGTEEMPHAFANLVCLASHTGRPVVVGIEYSADWQPAIDAYIHSDGGPVARAGLLSIPVWHTSIQDGRGSTAFLRMLEQFRQMKQSGQIDAVHGYDVGKSWRPDETRDSVIAKNWMATPAREHAIILLLSGNVHAMRHPMQQPGGAIITAASLMPSEQTITVNFAGNGGQAWVCRAEACGVHRNGVPRAAPAGLVRSARDTDPWHFIYELGRPTTASAPVTGSTVP